MTLEELKSAKAPFKVRSKVEPKRISIVTGFSQNDPLGVGGGIFPDMPTAYFKGGGWLLVDHLLENYDLVRRVDSGTQKEGQ